MIDESALFRQATLMICGNLEIEAAMAACLGKTYCQPFETSP